MNRNHACDYSSSGPGIVIAAVANTGPQAHLHALFANMPIAVEEARRTHKTIIVEGVNDRNPGLLASGENGRGNHDEGIVHMHNARSFPLKQSFEFPPRVGCPYSAWNECETLKSRKGFDFIVAAEIRNYFVASISQHVALLLDDDILTARMLIPIVYDEDLHV
jgi:hypothetical protein